MQLTSLGLQDRVPVLHTYYPSHFAYLQETCAIGSPAWLGALDPCDRRVLFVHPICAHSTAVKEEVLRRAGFWFVDGESRGGGRGGLPRQTQQHWKKFMRQFSNTIAQTARLFLSLRGREPAAWEQPGAPLLLRSQGWPPCAELRS
jgi:alpha-beta hydrolase superfamily lysophospholipase